MVAIWRDFYRYRFQSTKKPVTSLQQSDHYRRCVKGLGIPPYRSTSTKALSTSSTFQRSFSFPASRSTRDRSALKYVPSVLPLARGPRGSWAGVIWGARGSWVAGGAPGG